MANTVLNGSNVTLGGLTGSNSNMNVFMSGFTQTGNNITVTVFAQGSSTPLGSISGGSTNGSPAAMSTAMFQIQPNTTYYATVTAANGAATQVLYSYVSVSSGDTVYGGTCLLAVEDGSDADFNDAAVTMTWAAYTG